MVCSLEQWRDLLALHTYPAGLVCSTFANAGYTNIELYYYCKYKIYRAYRLYCRVLSCIHIQQVWAVLPVYNNGCMQYAYYALYQSVTNIFEYSNIRIYWSQIYIRTFVHINFSFTNIFGHSFVSNLFVRIYSDIRW